MSEHQGAGSCRWAVPTLFLKWPIWADAADRPWSCVRDETPYELESTDLCRTCVRWEPRMASAVSFGEPCDHLRSEPFFLDIFN
jgi:hypothetical protein